MSVGIHTLVRMTVAAVRNQFRGLPVTGGTSLPDFRVGLTAGDVAGLAGRLQDVDHSLAPDVDLLARAVGWEQVVAMAQAAQAAILAELSARTGVGAARVVDELQAARSCTQFQAQRAVLRALDLAAHPGVAGAMRSGDLDVRKADAVLDNLPRGEDPRRWDGVVDVLLDEATWLSAPALKRRTAALVIAAEPAEASARCARARADRSVSLQHLGDSMALLTAYLPAPDAVAAFTVVDAAAGTRREAGDARNIDQRRADAFSGIFAGILETGVLPGLGVGASPASAGAVGASDTAGAVAGAATAGGEPLPRKQRRRPEIQVTVAATTLLGLDELPGELAGYGPIPADMARAIAQDGTWRRILTDPSTGVLVERGDATYRPGADLTGTVIARDVTCVYMGCGQPGWRCELDHREPFDPARAAADQTTADNLDARCKHHHDLKGTGGWTARRLPSGASEWTDPFGVTFTRLAIPIAITQAVWDRLRGPCHLPGTGDLRGAGDLRPRGGYPDEPPY